jgi:hypothetical protein
VANIELQRAVFDGDRRPRPAAHIVERRDMNARILSQADLRGVGHLQDRGRVRVRDRQGVIGNTERADDLVERAGVAQLVSDRTVDPSKKLI